MIMGMGMLALWSQCCTPEFVVALYNDEYLDGKCGRSNVHPV